MKLLAISGSTRAASTNTALLRWLAAQAGIGVTIDVHAELAELPVFSPDCEGFSTPASVRSFADKIVGADGIIISSPEYVRAIPGGLKNAVDWLVSRDELIEKPIFLVHASHRGDDMLDSLRMVLSTVSSRFDESIFLRLPLAGKIDKDIEALLAEEESISLARIFLDRAALSARA